MPASHPVPGRVAETVLVGEAGVSSAGVSLPGATLPGDSLHESPRHDLIGPDRGQGEASAGGAHLRGEARRPHPEAGAQPGNAAALAVWDARTVRGFLELRFLIFLPARDRGMRNPADRI